MCKGRRNDIGSRLSLAIVHVATNRHNNTQLANYSAALETSLEALRIFEQLNDEQGCAETQTAVGIACYFLGDLERSLKHALTALKLYEKLNDDTKVASALNNIGTIYDLLKDYDQALKYYQACLETLNSSDKSYGRAMTLNNIGLVYKNLGEAELALDYFEQGLKFSQDSGVLRGVAVALGVSGEIYAKQGKFDLGVGRILESLEHFRSIGDLKYQADALISLGQLYTAQGHSSAFDYLKEALAAAEQAGAKISIYEAHEALADAYKQAGDFAAALEHFEHFHKLEREVFNEYSDKKLKGLQISFQLEQAEKEREIYRLKHIELEKAFDELQDLHQQLEAQSRRLEQQNKEDALTGLYNRRYLDERLSEEFRRARRYNHPLSVAICDIDFFKRINDKLSHAIGDETLKTVARIMKQNCREVDIIARYGGEEFVLAFLETPLEQAATACENIRHKIETYPWQEIHPDLKVTISIGLSNDLSLPHHEQLLTLADTKLYEAKHNGKNQLRY